MATTETSPRASDALNTLDKSTHVVRQRMAGLDGLRGLAAVIVLLSHLSGQDMLLVPAVPALDFSGTGKSGVYLFFILSAFLLSSQLLLWKPEWFRDRKRWSSYFQGRFFRIWPLLFVVALTCFLTTMIPALDEEGFPLSMSFKEFWRTLIFKHGEKYLWTIPAEFKFYFVLPLIIAILVLALRKHFMVCSSVLTVAVGACFLFINPEEMSNTSPIPFMGIFLSGVLAALLNERLNARPNMPDAWRKVFEITAWICVPVFFLTVPAILRAITGQPVAKDAFQESFFLFSTLWCVLILGMLHGSGTMRRLLDAPALVGLGTISYSLYLWHYGVIKMLAKFSSAPVWVNAWLAVIVSILLATVSYYVIERPVLAWSTKRRKAVLAATGTPHS